MPNRRDSPPGKPNKAGSSGRSPFPRMSNNVRPAEEDSRTGLQAGWESWWPVATQLHIGLSGSMLSRLRVCWDCRTLVGVGVLEESGVSGEPPGVGLAIVPGSGLQ